MFCLQCKLFRGRIWIKIVKYDIINGLVNVNKYCFVNSFFILLICITIHVVMDLANITWS